MTTLYESLESRRAYAQLVEEEGETPLQCAMPASQAPEMPLYHDAAERRASKRNAFGAGSMSMDFFRRPATDAA